MESYKSQRWALFLTLCTTLWLPEAAGSTLNCHKMCICAANIVSCSKMNLTIVPTVKLPNLHNLLLSHNGLQFLSSEAFTNVKHVRYLDLSSNELKQLDEFIFEPLSRLEVLLLYNNKISQIDRTAFMSMINLQKLYLSQNQISRFPVELVKEKTRLEKLSLLDVSSNRIKILPIDELQMLPAWIKNDDYTCVLPGPQKTQVRVFDLSGDSMNCSTFKEADEEAFLEQTLTLSCDTKHRNMLKTWTLPGNVLVTPESNQTAKVLSDGNLQISPVRSEDSGTYTCFPQVIFTTQCFITLMICQTMKGAAGRCILQQVCCDKATSFLYV
uniref:Adhesion molecule with Ig like domain 1 n=1 Tax=Amphilophus citrinellus TaxID=61819 RepID=A0A3Q0R9F2_AMPCI